MFRLMLNAHPRLHVPGETWFLTDLMDALPMGRPLTPAELDRALEVVEGHWRWREWEIPDDELRAAARALTDPTLADFVGALYSLPLAREGKVRWGDKTPGYLTEIPRLHALFPEARFLHVIRDGRDVCLSLRKTGWHGETTWDIARYWGSEVARAYHDGRALPPGQYLEVAYEDLVVDTRATLERVCDFLGEEFAPAMLEFHETAEESIPDRTHEHLSKTFREPRPSDTQRWLREMSFRHLLIFEAFAGDTLQMTGYDRRFRSGLAPVRAACRLVEKTARVTLPARSKVGMHFPETRRKL